jgi:hypothetical protein
MAKDIRVSINVEVSDAIKGLKALQREAKKATQSLAEIKPDKKAEYLRNLEIDESQSKAKYHLTNELIYAAYQAQAEGDLYFDRCSGVTTSIRALEKTFEDVAYIQYGKGYFGNFNGKVVFTDPKVKLPRGVRPKCHIRIVAIDSDIVCR